MSALQWDRLWLRAGDPVTVEVGGLRALSNVMVGVDGEQNGLT